MPIDITTELGRVRYNIGDVVEPYRISDDTINALLLLYPSPEYSSDRRVWKTTLDCLYLLRAQYANESSRRREREGSVEIEVYHNTNFGWINDLIDWFKDNPPDDEPRGYDLHIFGGVSKKEKRRVVDDCDSARPWPKIDGTYGEDIKYIPESFEGIRDD